MGMRGGAKAREAKVFAKHEFSWDPEQREGETRCERRRGRGRGGEGNGGAPGRGLHRYSSVTERAEAVTKPRILLGGGGGENGLSTRQPVPGPPPPAQGGLGPGAAADARDGQRRTPPPRQQPRGLEALTRVFPGLVPRWPT